ncbi:hypothetical protein B566_EDAN010291 [Ephemera danica]|nr:hypothetical protein B566_EDAN010291 [Ephemera danica]
MGPKKKGKQNKLARMSDDERMRYLQHKAAQEEEARRRKQQLIATFLKNKIKQEENFARLNQAKIDEQWRHLLRKAKCKELKVELETSRKQFEHLLMRRNQVINNLQEDLHESECQYLVILQAHMEAVDKILCKPNIFHHI